jgi:hypothetical protein
MECIRLGYVAWRLRHLRDRSRHGIESVWHFSFSSIDGFRKQKVSCLIVSSFKVVNERPSLTQQTELTFTVNCKLLFSSTTRRFCMCVEKIPRHMSQIPCHTNVRKGMDTRNPSLQHYLSTLLSLMHAAQPQDQDLILRFSCVSLMLSSWKLNL